MDVISISALSSIAAILVLLAWFIKGRRRRRPQTLPYSTLVVADCMQPQVVCRSVPLQHPYYRVISECSQGGEVLHNTKKESPIDPAEWHKKLNSTQLTRKDSINRRQFEDTERIVLPGLKISPLVIA